jgi:hypothetical protein
VLKFEAAIMTYMMRVSSRPVTFQPLARLRTHLVRRTSITSVLLILVIVTSASACVAGGGGQPAPSCPRTSTRRACNRTGPCIATTMGPACGDILRSLPGRCGMRSFIQLQFVTLPAFEISAPLQHTASCIAVPFDSRIVVSSIGSPETDRGPPHS